MVSVQYSYEERIIPNWLAFLFSRSDIVLLSQKPPANVHISAAWRTIELFLHSRSASSADYYLENYSAEPSYHFN